MRKSWPQSNRTCSKKSMRFAAPKAIQEVRGQLHSCISLKDIEHPSSICGVVHDAAHEEELHQQLQKQMEAQWEQYIRNMDVILDWDDTCIVNASHLTFLARFFPLPIFVFQGIYKCWLETIYFLVFPFFCLKHLYGCEAD